MSFCFATELNNFLCATIKSQTKERRASEDVWEMRIFVVRLQSLTFVSTELETKELLSWPRYFMCCLHSTVQISDALQNFFPRLRNKSFYFFSLSLCFKFFSFFPKLLFLFFQLYELLKTSHVISIVY